MKHRLPPLHPIFFAVAPVLSLYGRCANELPAHEIVRPLLALLGLGVLLVLLLALKREGREVPALAWSGLMFVTFLYGSLLHGVLVLCPPLPALALATFLWLGLGVAVVLLARRLRPHATAATRYANLCGLALVLVALSPLASRRPAARPTAPLAACHRLALPAGSSLAERPDIYVIILDGLARPDVFRQVYGGDLGPFADFLRGKGFRLVPQAHANYSSTLLVFSSLLNLDYLQSLLPHLRPQQKDLLPLYHLLETARVPRLLKQAGYATVCYPGIFPWGHMPADEVVGSSPLSDFELKVLQDTPWAAAPYAAAAAPNWPPLAVADLATMHRQQELRILDTLGTAPPARRPAFVFAHCMSPHPPFYFRADGSRGPQVEMILGSGDDCALKGEAFRRAYREQAEFVTRRLRGLVERLLRLPGPEPVIVLTSDHGPASNDDGSPQASAALLQERMSIFTAVRLPGGRDPGLPPDASPLVTLRTVLKACFDTDLPAPANRGYFSKYKRPFVFTEYPAPH